MRDWIIGLQKAATQRNAGVNPNEWLSIESDAGLPVPGELRELYEAMDGARLNPDVRLLTFRSSSEGPGALEQSRSHIAGLPARGVWLFGVKGTGQQLFAARRRELSSMPTPQPEWLTSVGDDGFVFGVRKTSEDVKFYRTLEQLLTRLVPPAQTEEFGDITYARALSAVQGALDLLEDAKTDSFEANEEIGRTTKVEIPAALRAKATKPKRAKAKAKAKPKARKPAKPKRKAKKPAAKMAKPKRR
jgi:hypothetical protein